MELEIPESEDEVVAAVDATGVKVTNRGEWLRKHYKGKRKGWIKVHVAVDAESKELLSIEMTDKKTGDSEVFGDLVESLNLDDCLADGAYDSEEIFELLEEQGVDPPPSVKLRKDTTPNLSPKGDTIRKFQEQEFEEWEEEHDSSKRWAVEGFFSAVKHCFGETVRTASPKGMIREVKRKLALYNLVKSI